MTDLDEQLDAACADGRMTTGDADTIREFADVLTAMGQAGDDYQLRRKVIVDHHDFIMGPLPHPAGCPGCADTERGAS